MQPRLATPFWARCASELVWIADGSSAHGIGWGLRNEVLSHFDQSVAVGRSRLAASERSTKTSGTVTEFSVPSDSNPVAITAGPDGKLWFTDDTDNPAPDRIGRITTSGTVNEFDLPIGHSRPQGIAPGPDGNLWFAEIGSPQEIGKITTSGTITEFPVPCTCGAPYDIGPGPDGNLWSTDFIGLLIRRITPSGTITEFPVPTTSNLLGSAPGPDGNVWFTEVNANNVDRATAAAPKTAYVLSMDAGFAPKTVSLKKQGFTLKWMFLGPNTHSATDSSGMGLFDSGTHSFVTFFSFKFIAAGTYPYKDTLHPTLTGTVKVPILVKPVTGHTDQAQVTWSSAAPPAGYAFDIQVEQPGSTSFMSWKTGQTATNALFGPADPKYVGAGTYRFQARLRNTGNGKASGYSSAKSITLT